MTTSDAIFSLDAECYEFERSAAVAAAEHSSEHSGSGSTSGRGIAATAGGGVLGLSNQSFAQRLFNLGESGRRSSSLDRYSNGWY